jgi:heme O synthase-like polyprenyltransferase
MLTLTFFIGLTNTKSTLSSPQKIAIARNGMILGEKSTTKKENIIEEKNRKKMEKKRTKKKKISL